MKELVEVLIKDQSIFSFGDHFINSHKLFSKIIMYEYSCKKIDVDHLKDLKGYITME